jgi:hypothetical protein
VLINNSTNINKTKKPPITITHSPTKHNTTYEAGHPGTGFGHAEKYGRAKPPQKRDEFRCYGKVSSVRSTNPVKSHK